MLSNNVCTVCVKRIEQDLVFYQPITCKVNIILREFDADSVPGVDHGLRREIRHDHYERRIAVRFSHSAPGWISPETLKKISILLRQLLPIRYGMHSHIRL